MQRVLVIGCGGAGKSTLSRRLGQLLGIPVVHLDSLYWKPGWVESDKTEWADCVQRVARGDSWIMDGNYSGTLAARLDACDTVIFLDMPRLTCLWRVAKRVIRYRGSARPEMPVGCPERFDLTFLAWIWNYPNGSKRRVLALLDAHRSVRKVVHLRSQRDVERFLANPSAV